MNDMAAARWSNHDISSDGRIVEECVHTSDERRQVVWYDRRGDVMRRDVLDSGLPRSGRSHPFG